MNTPKRYRKEDDISYALGMTLTFELLYHRKEAVTFIYIHSSINKNEAYDKLIDLCNKNNIPYGVNDKAFNILSQKENCFVIGEFKKFSCKLDSVASHIALVNPSNSGNMGTIMRSALGFGIDNLCIISPAVDIFDPKTVRASMGAIFSIKHQYFESFEAYQNLYPKHTPYPFMLKATHTLHDVKFIKPFTLTFGNEATGLPDDFLAKGESVIIPHTSKIDSLNLPIAASIALYESTKDTFIK